MRILSKVQASLFYYGNPLSEVHLVNWHLKCKTCSLHGEPSHSNVYNRALNTDDPLALPAPKPSNQNESLFNDDFLGILSLIKLVTDLVSSK